MPASSAAGTVKQMDPNRCDAIGSPRSVVSNFENRNIAILRPESESPSVMECVRTDRGDAFQSLRVSYHRPKVNPARENLAGASRSARRDRSILHNRHYTISASAIRSCMSDQLLPFSHRLAALFFRQSATQSARNYRQVCAYRCISVSCIVSHECYLIITIISSIYM